MRNPNSKVTEFCKTVSPCGSRFHVKYEARFNGKSIGLVESGKIDIQESINAYAPYTDLNYMLSRLSVGDSSVLCSRRPMYGDFSAMPDNPIDAINLVHSAESAFLSIPIEERQNFNNDYRVWLAALLSGACNTKPSEKSNPDPGTTDPE